MWPISCKSRKTESSRVMQKKVAQDNHVSLTVVCKVEKRLNSGEPASRVVKSQKVSNTNAMSYDRDLLKARMTALPIEKQTTQVDLAEALRVSANTIKCLKKEGVIVLLQRFQAGALCGSL